MATNNWIRDISTFWIRFLEKLLESLSLLYMYSVLCDKMGTIQR